jgi:adenylate cyclase
MERARVERRLAAILAADVAGYSRLIEVDEEGTLARFNAIRADLVDRKISEHRGRIVKTTGDGLLVEFSSVIDALRCATEVQGGMTKRNAAVPADLRIEWRIGINVGDIVVEAGDIFGDGVNIAVRLESLAEPGGICVSARVREDAAGKLDISFVDMGEQQLRNIARPVRVYRVGTGAASRPSLPLPLPDKPSIVVLAFTNMSGDPEQEFSPTASPRTSSPRCRNRGHCSSSPAIRASPTRAGRSRSKTSVASWVSATCSKAACERAAEECE